MKQKIRVKLYNSFMLISIVFALVPCSLFVKEGCTDGMALNEDFEATENDGSCKYSKVIFYGSVFSPLSSGYGFNKW